MRSDQEITPNGITLNGISNIFNMYSVKFRVITIKFGLQN